MLLEHLQHLKNLQPYMHPRGQEEQRTSDAPKHSGVLTGSKLCACRGQILDRAKQQLAGIAGLAAPAAADALAAAAFLEQLTSQQASASACQSAISYSLNAVCAQRRYVFELPFRKTPISV